MHIRSLLAAPAMVVVALSCSGIALADDPFEWPELPYEPCFRVERVLTSTEICAQGGSATGRAINAHGTIVGDASCGLGPSRAYVWRVNEPFQWIPTPPGTNNSWAWAINDDGWVAGQLSGGPATGNGFAWHEGTGEFHLIPPPYATGSVRPRGINADGVVVGTFVTNEPNVTPGQGIIWKAGKLTRLEELYDFGGRTHFPMDIDDDGTITGYFPAGEGGTAAARPFLIKDGTLYEFDPFPKGWGGTVPGVMLHGGVFMAESWDNRDLPGVRIGVYGDESGFLGEVSLPQQTLFRRVASNSGNASGDVVGGGLKLVGDWETIVIRRGVLMVLGDLMIGPFTDYGNARGISSNGQIATGPGHLVPTPPPLGDLNRNCRRDLSDLPLLLAQWGTGKGAADFNSDGRVDLQDLLILLQLIADDQSY